jgi:hypothetical protein
MVCLGVSTFQAPQSPDLTPFDFSMWSFVKDEAYVLPMPITLNNLKNQQKSLPKVNSKLYGTRSNIASKYAGHQIQHTLNFHRAYKKKAVSCSLKQQVFNFCVAITFLPTSG